MKPDLPYQPTYNDFYFIANGKQADEALLQEDKRLLKDWELSDQQERKVIGFEKL